MNKDKIIDFFGNPAYENFLRLVKEKYQSLGREGGIVQIIPTTEKEAEELSILLSTNIKELTKNTISLKHFRKCLDDSKFEGLTISELLKILNPKIETKKEEQERKDSSKNQKIQALKDHYKNTLISSWLEKSFSENNSVSKKIIQNIDNPALMPSLDALNYLPKYKNKTMQIAVFSSMITKDPHYFDLDKPNSNLFFTLLADYLVKVKPESHQEKIELLEEVGITIDDISNFVITYGLKGNEGLDYFEQNSTPVILNLDNIRKIPMVQTINKKLLIVENPSFLNYIREKKNQFSILVTSGNPNLALYKIMERLEDCDIYCQCDFDPEGLLIADKLKSRYPKIKLIGYNKQVYEERKSNKTILESRLKKLSHIQNAELFPIKEKLLQDKVSVYQEEMYDLLWKEISTINE